jgi:hypothetical protein
MRQPLTFPRGFASLRSRLTARAKVHSIVRKRRRAWTLQYAPAAAIPLAQRQNGTWYESNRMAFNPVSGRPNKQKERPVGTRTHVWEPRDPALAISHAQRQEIVRFASR